LTTKSTHGGARPNSGRKAPAGVRKNYGLRLSDSEASYIQQKANEAGLTISEYIRGKALDTLAFETRESESEHIRLALTDYLKNKEEAKMTLLDWQEKMMEETEGTVTISCVMQDVPHHENTSRYQVYNEEGTFDKLFDITVNDDGEITNIE